MIMCATGEVARTSPPVGTGGVTERAPEWAPAS